MGARREAISLRGGSGRSNSGQGREAGAAAAALLLQAQCAARAIAAPMHPLIWAGRQLAQTRGIWAAAVVRHFKLLVPRKRLARSALALPARRQLFPGSLKAHNQRRVSPSRPLPVQLLLPAVCWRWERVRVSWAELGKSGRSKAIDNAEPADRVSRGPMQRVARMRTVPPSRPSAAPNHLTSHQASVQKTGIAPPLASQTLPWRPRASVGLLGPPAPQKSAGGPWACLGWNWRAAQRTKTTSLQAAAGGGRRPAAAAGTQQQQQRRQKSR